MSRIHGLSLLLHILLHNSSHITVLWRWCWWVEMFQTRLQRLAWASDKTSNVVWAPLCLCLRHPSASVPVQSLWFSQCLSEMSAVSDCCYAGTQREKIDIHVSQFFLGCGGLYHCKACPRIPRISISWGSCRNCGVCWLVVLREFACTFWTAV